MAAKCYADAVDDQNVRRRRDMPTFVRDWALATYGLKSLAEKALATLSAAVCRGTRERVAFGRSWCLTWHVRLADQIS